MPDAYLPSLDEFALEVQESEAVGAALATDDPWGWKPRDDATEAALKSAKSKMLAFHLQRHSDSCCYCRTNLKGAGPFMTDREHILPKSKAAFKALSYTMWNLAASCKRCNMQFKRSGDDFVLNKTDAAALQVSENYKFIHPNFDLWDHHLMRLEVALNGKRLVAFSNPSGSAKGGYTSAYFQLDQLTVNSFDEGQGLPTAEATGILADAIRKLEMHYGQRR